VTLVSPELVAPLRELHDAEQFRWLTRRFEWQDLEGVDVVFTATGDHELAREIHQRAHEQGNVLVNLAEDATLCDFHVPATTSNPDVSVAVSTGGASPRAASRIRDWLDSWLEDNHARVAAALEAGRDEASSPPSSDPATNPGSSEAAEAARTDKVYIVGAGPGDPGLLTVRARDLLQRADIVFYDRLVGPEVLAGIPASAEQVYVGKSVGCAHRANIAELLITAARAGQRVVRLKGGDPMVFGRGGEEILALEHAHIPYEIVAGVSALSSVAAAGGFPITYRGISSEIVVRSGHNLEDPAIRGAATIPSTTEPRGTTYVYFMPARRLSPIVEELLAEGVTPSTPVALVQRGTLPEQKVLHSSLGELISRAEAETVETPALLVVGEVVRFREPGRLFPILDESAASERS